MKFLREIISRVRYNKEMMNNLLQKIDIYLETCYDLNWIMIDLSGDIHFLNEEKIQKTLREQIDEMDDDYDSFIKTLLSGNYQFVGEILSTSDLLEEQNYFSEIKEE